VSEKTEAPRASASARAAGDEAPFASLEAGVSTHAASALQAPEVRSGKVEALRAQIASGAYRVEPHQIADSILEQLRVRTSSGR
jgi:flagellar biosynthesis anti-sigma factor FlgM